VQPEDQVIRYAERLATSIAWSAVGSGPPLVVGGWWSSHLELDWRNVKFRRFVGLLARHRTVIRYDRPGAGVSDRGAMPPRSLEEELATLEALVEEAAPGPLALFGASSGGGVASLFAARHPERVERLVLYGSYSRGVDLAPPAAREAMLAVIDRHWGLGSRVLADVFLPDATVEERAEFVEFQRRSASREVALASLRAVYEFDSTGHLGDVLAPTLVLHRRDDRAIPFALGKDVAARIRNARFVPLEGDDHFPWRGDAESVARETLGFLGVPVESDLTRLDADVAILGVPHGWPYPYSGATAGCADAPAAIRRRSQRLARFVDHWDFDLDGPMRVPRVVDAGDVPGDPADGPGNSRQTAAAVAEILDRGAVPICIGGDDSVPIPILRAYEGRGPITVLQVDAHLDFRDEVDGVREGYSSPMRRASEMSHVDRIIQVGLRGVGSAHASDVEDARAAGNLLVTARELRERGVGWLLGQLPADASVFVSFDCDGLDPSVVPAVSAPAPGGLGYVEAWDLLSGVGSRLAGAALTEYVPALDASGGSALVVGRLAICLIGAASGGESPSAKAMSRPV